MKEVQKERFTESARELHKALGIKFRFSSWFEDQARRLNLESERNYRGVSYIHPQNKQKMSDYLLTKEASMMIAGRSNSSSEETAMVQSNFAMQAMSMNQLIEDPEQAVLFFSQIAARQAQKLKEKDELLKLQEPKVESFDKLMSSEDSIYVGQLSKVLAIKGMGRNNLFSFLRNKGVLNNKNEPYQFYMNRHWFKKKVSTWHNPHTGSEHVNLVTMVLPEGMDGIRKMLKKEGYTNGKI